jgi:glutamyl-tRNA synthetase
VSRVSVKINGGPSTAEVKVLPTHKKNPAIGEKKTVFTSDILVEQEDALSFDDQEEVRSAPSNHRSSLTPL